ncbi:MAG: sodium:calcium antiporter [Chloroflexi bacterium]|nr:MAG: sodium:calcium antiporter [Chloroflexota bacterium]
MDVVILAGAFVVILIGAELFTNGIEWVGHKLNLAEGAVGSVLAAVGTALPETTIPLIAILVGGTEAANEVGVGAILGAPFMLSTLAMLVTGIAVLVVARRRTTQDVMLVNTRVLAADMRYFAVAYVIALAAAFLPADLGWPRWIVALVLLGIYAYYVRMHFKEEAAASSSDDLAPLRLQRLDRKAPADLETPRLRIVYFQVVLALACIILGAYAFVGAVERLAHALGFGEALLALIIAPIATELPEKFNSVIWVRQGKDTLAMGNITGAMVFQSTIPTVVALAFASEHWAITQDTLLVFGSALIAFASSAAIFLPMAWSGRLRGRGLLVGGAFYVLYLGAVVRSLATGGT